MQIIQYALAGLASVGFAIATGAAYINSINDKLGVATKALSVINFGM